VLGGSLILLITVSFECIKKILNQRTLGSKVFFEEKKGKKRKRESKNHWFVVMLKKPQRIGKFSGNYLILSKNKENHG